MVNPFGLLSFQERQAIARRLTERTTPTNDLHRWSDGRVVAASSSALVTTVASRLHPDHYDVYPELPPITTDDVLDALRLVNVARQDLEHRELTLIAAARSAEVSWEQLGQALGYEPGGARQGGSGRFRRLSARQPGFNPDQQWRITRTDRDGAR